MWIPVRIYATNFLSFKQLDYHFLQKKTVIVEGENLTDEGQESNGSGKSALFEIPYYCLLGASSTGRRDVKLIHWGKKDAGVGFELYNTMTKQKLTIERELFATKSSKLYIEINGEDQGKLFPTVNEGNKFILQLIGISAEDLKNYYFINSEKFVSFFKSSDTDKRKLIARFSSADRIQNVDPIIEKRTQPLLQSIEDYKSTITKNGGKIELYEEQIEQLRQENTQEKLDGQRQELKDKIQAVEDRKKELSDLIVSKGLESAQKETVLQSFTQDFKTIDAKVKKIQADSSEQALTKVQEQILKSQEVERQLSLQISSKREEITELETEIQPFIIALGGEIECPNCKHHFIQGVEMEVEEIEELVKETKGEVESLKAQRNTLLEKKKKIVEARKPLQEQETKLKKKVSENQAMIYSLQKQKMDDIKRQQSIAKEISNIDAEVSRYKVELSAQNEYKKGYEKELKEIPKKITESAEIKEKEELIAKINKENTYLQEVIGSVEDTVREHKEWGLNMKNFYVYLTNKSLNSIQGYCNLYLRRFKSNLQVRFEGFKLLADNKTIRESITAIICRDGQEEEDYRCFSGGERGRLIFSTILTFQELINNKAETGGLDLCFVDEVLDQVDPLGMRLFRDSLSEVERTVLLLSQVRTGDVGENTLRICKEEGLSFIKK